MDVYSLQRALSIQWYDKMFQDGQFEAQKMAKAGHTPFMGVA
jgi:hypothetical protein